MTCPLFATSGIRVDGDGPKSNFLVFGGLNIIRFFSNDLKNNYSKLRDKNIFKP